jgi:hypothetical protein
MAQTRIPHCYPFSIAGTTALEADVGALQVVTARTTLFGLRHFDDVRRAADLLGVVLSEGSMRPKKERTSKHHRGDETHGHDNDPPMWFPPPELG